MATIFNEIKPNGNLNFGELNDSDLRYLLGLINKYKLSLRECLGVDMSQTFGLELESDKVNRQPIREKNSLGGNWKKNVLLGKAQNLYHLYYMIQKVTGML